MVQMLVEWDIYSNVLHLILGTLLLEGQLPQYTPYRPPGGQSVNGMCPVLNQMQQVGAHTYLSQHPTDPPFLGMVANP